MAKQPIYPFTAIVGQRQMKRALILNAVDVRIGGVLVRGERGTGKSTAARALAALLPELDVFTESQFNDDPARPDTWSDAIRERSEKGETLHISRRKIPFVDLPVSATEDRVVGTLDIEKAIQKGERHFDPGVLAAANRGILYVDEVNLLDDHVVDLLLDSAAMGVNVIEREGISFSHPARFILVGTMNPEEGDLRPQLLDRFALSVDVHGIHDASDRMEIVQRHMAYEDNAEGFRRFWQPEEEKLAERITAGRSLVEAVRFTKRDIFSIASLTSSMHIDGHRADMVILKTARANAAFEGRTNITREDIMMAFELAIPHRLKRGPFADAQVTMTDMERKLEQAESQWGEGDTPEPSEDEQGEEQATKKKATP
ncbi:MAG: ATP-binding protein [Pleurocapsa minor GSE-CHR-MK-17-07R]|jgi:Mg-chelatase subunit ChlI|nr:ATP-binding protein [Pleurocapsa minor GSE-CHR-MK 17-07R]